MPKIEAKPMPRSKKKEKEEKEKEEKEKEEKEKKERAWMPFSRWSRASHPGECHPIWYVSGA